MDAGLLPVKGFDRAKARLGEMLGGEGRRAVARALFEDALTLLSDSADLLTWWVVSDDTTVLRTARSAGHRAVVDSGEGLNGALEEGIEEVRAAGASAALIVPCDVPLASRGDILDVLDTGATSDVVAVPSLRDGGTNALYLRPPDAIRPSFGQGSLEAHLAAAEGKGLRCSLLQLAGLSLDVDTVRDAREFLGHPASRGTQSARVLERTGLTPVTMTSEPHP